MRAVCIGECMVELRQSGTNSFLRSFAGDVYNTAVYLKRSFPETRVEFLTSTGDDAMSLAMRDSWRTEGIEDDLAFTVGGASPGLYFIETDQQGERRFQYWRANSAARQWLALLRPRAEELLRGADLVYLSGISLAILDDSDRRDAVELLRRIRPLVGRIAFDPNIRLALWQSIGHARQTLAAAMALADVVLPSTEDARLLFDTAQPLEQIGALQREGVREVALTLGASGCVVIQDAAPVRLSAPVVTQVVDTTGAGDAFNGAYLATRLRGGSPVEAATHALLVSSRVVTHGGAVVPALISHPA